MSFLESLGVQLDVLIAQLLNLLILFFVFKRLVGDSLQKALEERRELVSKLERADLEYAHIMQNAQDEKKKIIADAIATKDDILREANLLADKQQQEILAQATSKADAILADADRKAQQTQEALKQSFSQGVKQTSMQVVKKLLQSDAQLQTAYLDTLVQEYSNK